MSAARDELVARVRANLELVHERIAAAGRDPASLRIVAVTKALGPEAVHAAVGAGLLEVAENYANELVDKYDALSGAGARWHFLGALQRNKLARLAPRVNVYQGLASAGQAVALAVRAPSARCYVQVDLAGVAGRNGCAPSESREVVAAAQDQGLLVEGLMCVASADPARAEGEFTELRRLADDLGLEGCSMGMSGDFEAACRAGTTMLRLGRALLGPRAPTPPAQVA